jgi:hypothetical protein
MVDQAAELLDQLGDAGHAVRPQVLAALTDEVLSRRTMLGFIDTPEPTTTAPSPEELDSLAGQYEARHATAAPPALMTALTAHLRMVADALAHQPTAGTRQRLLRNRARTSVLAGQVSEDLGNPMAARAYYAQAADDGYELGELPVAAIAHGYAARLALREGQAAAALRHLDTAARLDLTDPAIVSWLSGIAEAAQAPNGTAAGRQLTAKPERRAAQPAMVSRAVPWFAYRAPQAAEASELPATPSTRHAELRMPAPPRPPREPATAARRAS